MPYRIAVSSVDAFARHSFPENLWKNPSNCFWAINAKVNFAAAFPSRFNAAPGHRATPDSQRPLPLTWYCPIPGPVLVILRDDDGSLHTARNARTTAGASVSLAEAPPVRFR